MRKFDKIKPLNLGIDMIPRFLGGTSKGGVYASKFVRKVNGRYYDQLGRDITDAARQEELLKAAELDKKREENTHWTGGFSGNLGYIAVNDNAGDATKVAVAGYNTVLAGKNIKDLKQQYDDGNLTKSAAVGRGIATGTAAVADTVASFINPGALNARDEKTEGMVNAGLDVVGLMGAYGAAIAAVGKLGMAGLNIAAKDMNKNIVDKELKASQGSAYEETFKSAEKAEHPGLKGVFRRSAAKAALQEAIYNMSVLKEINDKNEDAKAASGYEGIGLNNVSTLNGGFKPMRALSGLKFAKKVAKAAEGFLFARAYKAPESENQNNKIRAIDPYAGTMQKWETKIDKIKTVQQLIAHMKALGINTDLYDINQFASSEDFENYLKAERTALGTGTISEKYANVYHPFFTGAFGDLNGGAYNKDQTSFTPSALNYYQYAPSYYKREAEKRGIDIDYSAITGKKGYSDKWDPEDIFDDEKWNSDIKLWFYEQGLYAPEEVAKREAKLKADEVYADFKAKLDGITITEDMNAETYEAELNAIINMQDCPEELRAYALQLLEKFENDKEEEAERRSVQEEKNGGVLTVTIYPSDTQYLKEGGTFNVIPDGALHKNKHNMEDAEGLTKKGIPVITEEDGKKVLQAEIEVNEIIFRLEVTEKLEELAKEGTDEAALEAGKLLVKEILHNTLDNTGLIKETV